jgi:hypothetical protein
MEPPPEIQFQGLQGTPQIEEMIAAHIAELDERFGRITACRVVVKAPAHITAKATSMRCTFASRSPKARK